MGVTMYPAEVKAVGKKAEGVGTDDVAVAFGKLQTAAIASAFVGLKGFKSSPAFDELFDTWNTKTRGLAGCLEAVGGKLKDSANTYINTDDSSGDLFELKDAYAAAR